MVKSIKRGDSIGPPRPSTFWKGEGRRLRMSDQLKAQIANYLRARMPEMGVVEIVALSRIHGGASRETFRVRARTNQGERGLIFRRDPVSTLIETERQIEFAAYRSFHRSEVPVPGALALETET